MLINEQWLAGFFDGEGTIGITITGKHSRCSLRLMLVNTDFELLTLIHHGYGGLLTYRKSPKNHPTWKRSGCITWSNRKAAKFLERVGPHIVLKRRQVELAKEFLALKDVPNRLQSWKEAGEPKRSFVVRLSPELVVKENEIRQQFHVLNKKGKAA